MSDEFKQMWFKLRIDNFNEILLTSKIEIEGDFQKNLLKFKKK